MKHVKLFEDWVGAKYNDDDNEKLSSYYEDGHDKFKPMNEKYFFHGTSDKFLNDMDRLLKAPTYITRNHETAWWEGAYKVYGDQSEAAFKKPHVGGNVVMLVIDASVIDLNELAVDPGYPDPEWDQSYIYQKAIPKEAVVEVLRLKSGDVRLKDSKWIMGIDYPKETRYYSDGI